jgi:GTPase SAR1 family protein
VEPVFVGDAGTGNTSLILRYRDSRPPADVPVIIPDFAAAEAAGDGRVALGLRDSACHRAHI